MNKRLIITSLIGLLTLLANAQDVIKLEDFSIHPGETKKVTFELSTELDNYRGFQTDVLLPSGLTITRIEDVGRGGEDPDVNKRVGKATSVTVDGQEMKKQVVVLALDSNFQPGDGPLASITVKADEDMSQGSYTGYLQNVILSYSTGKTVAVANQQFCIDVGDDPVGIQSSTNQQVLNFNRDIYNLQGQNISVPTDCHAMPKGIYIQDGKKVLIK